MISNLKLLIVIPWASLRLIIWDDAMNVRNVWFTVCFNDFNVKQKYLLMYVTKNPNLKTDWWNYIKKQYSIMKIKNKTSPSFTIIIMIHVILKQKQTEIYL